MERAADPEGGWRVGDRAYCLKGTDASDPPVETGRVYRVKEVVPIPNHVNDGIGLEGVCGRFWGHRFIALRGPDALGQIARETHRKIIWQRRA